MSTFSILLIAWFAVLIGTLFAVRYYNRRSRLRSRIDLGEPVQETPEDPSGIPEALRHWLARSGMSRRTQVQQFIFIALVAFFAGAFVLVLLVGLDIAGLAISRLEGLPGNMAQLSAPILFAGPFFVALMIAAAPWLWVRGMYRTRTERIEQDLPLFLELLATLAESGLGFDESLNHILASQPQKRPLAAAFNQFQAEVRSGLSRSQCFMRLGRRLEVASARACTTALMQSEEVGGRISGVLRQQANDALARRRMRAMELATSLPVKVLFPMMICFLPGIFTVTLGPIFYQFISMIDQMITSYPVNF